MKSRSEFDALIAAAIVGACLSASAQPRPELGSPVASEQLEADYRVIAARCGSPAFEKAFFNDSKAAVVAGLVSKGRNPVDAEKAIAALRRSPFVLVAAPADCPAQLVQLKALQKSRNATLRAMRGHSAQAK